VSTSISAGSGPCAGSATRRTGDALVPKPLDSPDRSTSGGTGYASARPPHEDDPLGLDEDSERNESHHTLPSIGAVSKRTSQRDRGDMDWTHRGSTRAQVCPRSEPIPKDGDAPVADCSPRACTVARSGSDGGSARPSSIRAVGTKNVVPVTAVEKSSSRS
jgi:hypothetical protein